MTEFLPRKAWTRVAFSKKLVPFDPLRLKGVAVHYTGSSSPLGSTASLTRSVARLVAERQDHVGGRGWTDIAYNYAIDQEGRVFELRSDEYQSAANGDGTQNKLYAAVTFLIGVGDMPTCAALTAFKDWHREVWLKRWPFAAAVVGHRDLHATQCPGQALYALLNFLSNWPETAAVAKELKAMTPADLRNIADELFSDAPGEEGARYKVRRPDGSVAAIPTVLAEMYALLTDIRERLNG